MELTVTTLNCWSGLDYKGLLKMGYMEPKACLQLRQAALLKELASLDTSILFLNEINPTPAFIKKIATNVGMDYIYHLGVGGLRYRNIGLPINLRESDGIFARAELELKNLKRASLLRSGFVCNQVCCHIADHTQAVLGTVKILGKDIYLCCVHLHAVPDYDYYASCDLEKLGKSLGYSFKSIKKGYIDLKKAKAIKAKEINRLVEFLKKQVPSGAPLIVAGDFNADKNWRELLPLQNFGLVDIYDYAGIKEIYPTWNPDANQNLKSYYTPASKLHYKKFYDKLHALDELRPRAIDYIFIKNFEGLNLQVDELKLFGTENLFTYGGEAFPISDHYGILAKLQVG